MAKPFGSWSDRAEFLEIRSHGLGGSDIAAIIGESHWGTPLSVWAEKVHGKPAESDAENEEAKYWGSVLERVVRDEWNRRNGPRFAQTTNMTYRHDDYDYLLANSDGFIYPSPDAGLQDAVGVYEGKTANQFKASEWVEGVPDYYLPQPHWYMAVHGLPYAEVACLIGGQQYVQWRLDSDPGFEADLLEAAIQFWERYVVPRVAPAPSGKAVDGKVLKRIHQAVHGETLEADDELAQKVGLLKQWKRQFPDDPATLLLDQEVRAAVGSATCVEYAGRVIATYKESVKVTVDAVFSKRVAARLRGSHPRVARRMLVESSVRTLRTK